MSSNTPPTELDQRPQSRREWSGWLRSLVLPIGLLVAIVAGLLYFQSGRGGEIEDGPYGAVDLPAERNSTGRPPDAEVGRAAPDFLLPTLAGAGLRLSDLQGRPVLINFWASWCFSCRAETPALIEAYEGNSDAGLVVLGVNLREANERAATFVDEYGMPYPVVLDRSGQVARTWRIGGPNQGLPSSYFVDRHGVIQKVVYGTLSEKALADGFALILEQD
jgi:peroxiredoxin